MSHDDYHLTPSHPFNLANEVTKSQALEQPRPEKVARALDRGYDDGDGDDMMVVMVTVKMVKMMVMVMVKMTKMVKMAKMVMIIV